jgi:hypothetical protein
MILRSCAVSILVLMATHPRAANAGSLRKVWESDVRKALGAKLGDRFKDFRVSALRFSPDGRMVAAVLAGADKDRLTDEDRLLVIPVGHPEAKVREFQIRPGIEDGEDIPDLINFGWVDGNRINAAGTVIHLSDERTCDLPWGTVFFHPDRAIGRDRADFGADRNWRIPLSHFTIFGEDCRARETWEVAEEWNVLDVSADRGLLSIERLINPASASRRETLIVDPIARKVLQRWPWDEMPGNQFADYGKAICAGSDVSVTERAPVICRDIDTGRNINEAPTTNGGDPMSASTQSSRIVASDYRRRRIPFSDEYAEVFKRRVVWDFRTGKEIVSWHPDVQTYEASTYAARPPKQTSEPFKFAISPDGQYVVEGGSGIIRVSKIEP